MECIRLLGAKKSEEEDFRARLGFPGVAHKTPGGAKAGALFCRIQLYYSTLTSIMLPSILRHPTLSEVPS